MNREEVRSIYNIILSAPSQHFAPRDEIDGSHHLENSNDGAEYLKILRPRATQKSQKIFATINYVCLTEKNLSRFGNIVNQGFVDIFGGRMPFIIK